jgi:beta propeller repeat protein
MYDLSNQTETQITSNSRTQEMPRISGNYIVWEDTVHQEGPAKGNVFAYDLSNKTEIKITQDLGWEHSPATYGNKIVWTGVRNHNPDIYMVNFSRKLPKLNIELRVGSPNMVINGETMEIDPGRGTKPLIIKGTTLIPLRAFIEALGGTVEWNTFEQKVTINIIDKKMELWIGKKTAIVNEETKTLEVPPQGINGRTMLPLRFVAENLGLDVNWNNTTGTILISTEG